MLTYRLILFAIYYAVTLLNTYRLNQSMPLVGFLNPTLYSNKSTALFNDITSGSNNCCSYSGSIESAGSATCCAQGFRATAGWDPVTGLGSVYFPRFAAMFGIHLPFQIQNYTFADAVTSKAPLLTQGESIAVAFLGALVLVICVVFAYCCNCRHKVNKVVTSLDIGQKETIIQSSGDMYTVSLQRLSFFGIAGRRSAVGVEPCDLVPGDSQEGLCRPASMTGTYCEDDRILPRFEDSADGEEDIVVRKVATPSRTMNSSFRSFTTPRNWKGSEKTMAVSDDGSPRGSEKSIAYGYDDTSPSLEVPLPSSEDEYGSAPGSISTDDIESNSPRGTPTIACTSSKKQLI